MAQRKNPAELLIEYFGGVNAAGRALKRSPSQVVRWRANGRIPVTVQKIILNGVETKNWNFKAEDLILGRKIKASK